VLGRHAKAQVLTSRRFELPSQAEFPGKGSGNRWRWNRDITGRKPELRSRRCLLEAGHTVGMRWFLHLLLIKMWPSQVESKARIHALELENLALRQQLAVLQRTGKRPKVTTWDWAFWVGLSRVWSGWKEACLLVKPATVVGWHRSGFQLFWRIKSHQRGGRPSRESGLRDMVCQVARENPLWGAPRIHGELLKLGFQVSERSVARWMPRRPRDPKRSQSWKTFSKTTGS
jgi:hypothetical protein